MADRPAQAVVTRMVIMFVKKTSIFPASKDAIFQKIKKPETLQYIAKPYAAFEPVSNTENGSWMVGSTSSYRFRLFGIIPFGTHTIHIVRFDPDGIISRENNEHVPVWNHNITMVSLDDDHTEYTDRVEIHAGWKTVFVWLWANLFYAHRQKKWIRLLEESGMDDKQKSKFYFNRHSSTIINKNGYWSYDYRITAKILMRRNVKNLIDIGCGNGAFLAMFHKAAPDVKLSGLDLSGEMVAQSRKRLPGADIVEGDAENMPFADKTFGAVSCHMSIHHHPHPDKSLSEMYRILEKNGTVLINELTGPAPLRKFMNWWFTKWPTGDHAVYSRAEMEDMLRKTGFEHVRSRLITPFTYVCVGRKSACI